MISTWLAGFLVGLAPLFLLVGFLLLGRYPGERAIGRWRQLLVELTGARTAAVPAVRDLAPRRSRLRGGRLIASSMAGRGPPLTC